MTEHDGGKPASLNWPADGRGLTQLHSAWRGVSTACRVALSRSKPWHTENPDTCSLSNPYQWTAAPTSDSGTRSIRAKLTRINGKIVCRLEPANQEKAARESHFDQPHSAVNAGAGKLRALAAAAQGERAMVATVHPLATDAGIAAFERGGNAVDAAVAAALTLGVVDGYNSGIGGGCLILVRTPTGEMIAIDGREAAPLALIAICSSARGRRRLTGAQRVRWPWRRPEHWPPTSNYFLPAAD